MAGKGVPLEQSTKATKSYRMIARPPSRSDASDVDRAAADGGVAGLVAAHAGRGAVLKIGADGEGIARQRDREAEQVALVGVRRLEVAVVIPDLLPPKSARAGGWPDALEARWNRA